MHHHNKIRMDIISQLIKHLIIKTVNIRQLRGMCIPNTLRQKERFPMRDQHTIPKINLTHAVLHRLDRLPHIDTRHRHQRHIRKLQPAVFPLHNKSSFHLKPLPALQLPHRLLIFYYHTASAIPMQQVAVSFGNCNCPAPFLILLRKGGCALLLHFLTPLHPGNSSAGALCRPTRHQQAHPLTFTPLTFTPLTFTPLTLTFHPPGTDRSAAARFLRRRCRSRSAVCRP